MLNMKTRKQQYAEQVKALKGFRDIGQSFRYQGILFHVAAHEAMIDGPAGPVETPALVAHYRDNSGRLVEQVFPVEHLQALKVANKIEGSYDDTSSDPLTVSPERAKALREQEQDDEDADLQARFEAQAKDLPVAPQSSGLVQSLPAKQPLADEPIDESVAEPAPPTDQATDQATEGQSDTDPDDDSDTDSEDATGESGIEDLSATGGSVDLDLSGPIAEDSPYVSPFERERQHLSSDQAPADDTGSPDDPDAQSQRDETIINDDQVVTLSTGGDPMDMPVYSYRDLRAAYIAGTRLITRAKSADEVSEAFVSFSRTRKS